MDKLITAVKLHWPGIVAFGAAFYSNFSVQINTWVATHPKYVGWAAAVTFTVGYYLRSPRQVVPAVAPQEAPKL